MSDGEEKCFIEYKKFNDKMIQRSFFIFLPNFFLIRLHFFEMRKVVEPSIVMIWLLVI